MDFCIKIIALFLLLTTNFMLCSSLQQSGRARSLRKSRSSAKLRDNIGENPFLQKNLTTTTTTTTTTTPQPLYQGNPFLTNTREPESHQDITTDHPKSAPRNAEENQVVNAPLYMNNPFLFSGTNGPATRSPNTIHTHIPLANDNHGSNVVNQPPISDRPVIFPYSDNSRSKSETQCEQYARQVARTSGGVVALVGSNPKVSEVSFDNCRLVNHLVIGGTAASLGEYPHMVALGRNDNGDFGFQCGGTLIAPEWILTAAHCTYGPSGGPTVARMGLNNLNEKQAGISVTIQTMIRHPSYKPPAMYADIALIKLQVAVTFNDNLKPACLYQSYDTAPTQAWVTGWGVTEFGEDQSDKLQKAQLDIVDNLACTIKHNTSIAVPYGVSPSMICAGDARGGWLKDTCQGDSGGPLQITHPDNGCLYQIIGITSFGQGCAMIDTPGVYTRVSHYLTWIEDHVWPNT